MAESMRLQRALARAGVASRRHSETLITAGRVTVNGETAHLGQSVDPSRDDIRVDGKRISAGSGTVWIVLNKPVGVMSTKSDPQGRRTVFELVEKVPGLTYVGRLDFMTEGVMLFTNDGDAAHALMHPSGGVERTYVAVVTGDANAAVKEARRGVDLEDGPVRPVSVNARAMDAGRWEFEVTITEGRKREVRRFCKALGLTVERLTRTRFGPVELGRLKPGESRPLRKDEVDSIARLVQQLASEGTPGA